MTYVCIFVLVRDLVFYLIYQFCWTLYLCSVLVPVRPLSEVICLMYMLLCGIASALSLYLVLFWISFHFALIVFVHYYRHRICYISLVISISSIKARRFSSLSFVLLYVLSPVILCFFLHSSYTGQSLIRWSGVRRTLHLLHIGGSSFFESPPI